MPHEGHNKRKLKTRLSENITLNNYKKTDSNKTIIILEEKRSPKILL